MTHTPHPNCPDDRSGRRAFMKWLTYGLGAVATAALGAPVIGYLFNIRPPRTVWQPLGPVSDFPLHETRLVTFDNKLAMPWDGKAGHTGVYVRNEGKDEDGKERFLVLSINCAHLGCPVTWFPQSGLFMCPCHGGVYYANGERASGPPPRGLFRCAWKVEDGQLVVRAPHYPTLQDPAYVTPA